MARSAAVKPQRRRRARARLPPRRTRGRGGGRPGSAAAAVNSADLRPATVRCPPVLGQTPGPSQPRGARGAPRRTLQSSETRGPVATPERFPRLRQVSGGPENWPPAPERGWGARRGPARRVTFGRSQASSPVFAAAQPHGAARPSAARPAAGSRAHAPRGPRAAGIPAPAGPADPRASAPPAALIPRRAAGPLPALPRPPRPVTLPGRRAARSRGQPGGAVRAALCPSSCPEPAEARGPWPPRRALERKVPGPLARRRPAPPPTSGGLLRAPRPPRSARLTCAPHLHGSTGSVRPATPPWPCGRDAARAEAVSSPETRGKRTVSAAV